MQDALAHPGTLPRSSGPMGWVVRGPWAVTGLADLMYSSKQAPFLVTETNAGSIGFSSMNESPYDGQWRQAGLAAGRARGPAHRVLALEHLALRRRDVLGRRASAQRRPRPRLPRDRADRPGAAFGRRGLHRGGTRLRHRGALRLRQQVRAVDAGAAAGEALIDPDSYRHILAAFSRGIFDAKRQQRLVRPQHLLPSRGGAGGEHDAADAAGAAGAAALVARYPVLIAAAFYTAADEDLDFLVRYARAGGHLVVGPRTGYGDREGRARLERAPGRIADAAGVWYDEMASLPSPVPVHGSLRGAALRGAATGFAEGLVASDAEVLATYEHPHLGRWAAVTTKAAGAGRITVVGTVPDQDLAAGLMRWLAPHAVDGWTTDNSVTVSTSTDTSAATRLHVLHNWSWEEATATASSAVTDLLDGGRHLPGVKITLGAWDVRLFRSDAGELPRRPVSDGAGAYAGGWWCPSARFWPGRDHRPY